MKKLLAGLFLFVYAYAAPVPMPKEHFGFTPGDDYKLAGSRQMAAYFQKLAAASDRIKLVEFGKSSYGRPMYVAFISAPENLARLERYRDISRRLALGVPESAEARRLAGEAKIFVWIDSGLHATEVAPVQHAPHLAYKMLTAEDEETRRIRRNVILMQVPVINPDGLDMVVDWYRKNVGTPHELAPLPRLYQKYAGHDNNRDYFMLNLAETRHVSRMLFREWFPQIVYNQHQQGPFPSRIFVPPYAEPLNPNIPAPLMEGINLIGSAMKERFAREDKPGVLSYWGYDAWWNGGLRSAPAFHNIHGILTETALYHYATPKEYKLSELPERFGNGIPTREPSIFYQRPWLGGRWALRDAVEYMLTADYAILDLASTRAPAFLYKAWELARANVDAGRKGNPFAYVAPADQWDRSSAIEMLRRLQMSGIEVHRAKAAFTANGKHYGAGSWVLLAGQPFRPYLIDLMAQQNYPELRAGTTGPTKRPYDVAGWTLSMNMGVQVDRIAEPFEADLDKLAEIEPEPPALDHRQNASFLATAELLAQSVNLRWSRDGKILKPEDPGYDRAAWELRPARAALYEPWAANIDTGWTQWLLDNYKVPYTLVHNDDFRRGGLRSRFDAVILAAQSAASILHGTRHGERSGGGTNPAAPEQAVQRPEYSGGIGIQGLAAIEEFVRGGGTLITLDTASELPIGFLPIGVRLAGATSGRGEPSSNTSFYCPGSLLRINVEPAHPIALGMPGDAIAFSTGSRPFEITTLADYNKGEREVRSIAKFAAKDVLASGWLSGERLIAARHAAVDARLGQGRVVMFAIRPQFRGQSFATFKLLLNAIYLASAKEIQ